MVKYNEIWNKIKKTLDIKFHRKSDYDKKYIRTQVKTSDDVVNTIFWSNKIPQKIIHSTCILVICISSVMNMNRKNYPQGYLEECRYEIKKKKMLKLIDVELDLDDSDDSYSE